MMIAVEANIGSAEMSGSRPAMEIRFQFVDGSEETLIQPDAEGAKAIRDKIHLSNLFTQPRIVVADDFSKSVFICDQINRIDFVFDGSGFPRTPTDHLDIVELTEAEFRQCVPVNDPSLLQKRERRLEPGDLMVSFLHLRMRGGRHVYLMREAVAKLPAESYSFMQRFLAKGTYRIRLREGGEGLLNLHNLIWYTVYPGVPELPTDSWIIQSQAVDE